MSQYDTVRDWIYNSEPFNQLELIEAMNKLGINDQDIVVTALNDMFDEGLVSYTDRILKVIEVLPSHKFVSLGYVDRKVEEQTCFLQEMQLKLFTDFVCSNCNTKAYSKGQKYCAECGGKILGIKYLEEE